MKHYIESASASGLAWTKSSFSGANGNCVEIAALVDGGRAVRDSKNADGPALCFTSQEWAAFVAGVHAGEFEL
ncbi:DUF397 domain-containing protein [Streptacidiphilus sp. P02-A3a]|uniref:DUF397 domain-containing protein n=1 Tax=Streptacidiphilus sp. P02-A3a TaxID=2704468 RepID=UPI0015FCEF11|nr:DUF397 domain-containing protein [Streptacidiphilus sp. P02-A3a]QMU72569.1 DUF397 domain-containing protein [Streptacidiphilus sp. P02-A3a]